MSRRPWDSWAEDDARFHQLGWLFTLVACVAAGVAVGLLAYTAWYHSGS